MRSSEEPSPRKVQHVEELQHPEGANSRRSDYPGSPAVPDGLLRTVQNRDGGKAAVGCGPYAITITPLPMQAESSAEDATARPSTRRRIQTTPVSSLIRIPATEVDPRTEGASSQASELLNGAMWVLASLDGRSVIDDTHLFLRVDGSVIEGFDGCNSLWGRHEDGTPIAKADGIFSGRQFGGTDIGCPDPIELQRVDSGRGQNRTLTLLSAFWPPVFAGEQAVGSSKGVRCGPGARARPSAVVFSMSDRLAEMVGIAVNDDGGELFSVSAPTVYRTLNRRLSY